MASGIDVLLRDLERACEGVKPRPEDRVWSVVGERLLRLDSEGNPSERPFTHEELRFIALARSAMPELIRMVRTLRQQAESDGMRA